MKKQLFTLGLLLFSFIGVIYSNKLYGLMLVGAWPSHQTFYWLLYISIFFTTSLLSMKFNNLKLLSVYLSVPIMSVILTKAQIHIFLGFYGTFLSNIGTNLIIGIGVLLLYIFHLTSFGLKSNIINIAILTSILAALPISFQIAYDIKDRDPLILDHLLINN